MHRRGEDEPRKDRAPLVSGHQRKRQLERAERERLVPHQQAASRRELKQQPAVHEDVHVWVQGVELNDEGAASHVKPLPLLKFRQQLLCRSQVHGQVEVKAISWILRLKAYHRRLLRLVRSVPLVVHPEVVRRPSRGPRQLALKAGLECRKALRLNFFPEHHAVLVVDDPELPQTDRAEEHGSFCITDVPGHPMHGLVLQPEDGGRVHYRGVGVFEGEGLGHEVIPQPLHQGPNVFDAIHRASPAHFGPVAASPIVHLLPSALVEVARPQ
mmetsp:Transcript_96859/g.269391  ORF Transcript_96859/g.269391 Transcript_96859/m.269391 type:complete len:270 (+) Transcript_96859:608-1417(+)